MPTTITSLTEWITSRSPEHTDGLLVSVRKRAHLKARGFIDNPNRPYTWQDWDDTFNAPVKNGHDRSVAQVGFDWLASLSSNAKKMIWFKGQTGMGKTHLACVLAVFYAIIEDKNLAYCNWAQRLGEIRDSYNGHSSAEHLMVEQNADILVLDDLGAERVTLWMLEMLYRLLESRRGRPTIITSNYPINAYCKRLYKSDKNSDEPAAVEGLAAKIDDRLKTGRGGYLIAEIGFTSQHGSYRRVQ